MKIFIAGADGSGKSTLARSLAKHYNLSQFAFGDMLRLYTHKKTGTSLSRLYEKPTSPEIRTLLRSMGEKERKKDKNFWVGKLKNHIKEINKESFVIDDMRFIKEWEFCKEVNGISIFLDTDFDESIPSFEELNHVKYLCDYIIPGNGTNDIKFVFLEAISYLKKTRTNQNYSLRHPLLN